MAKFTYKMQNILDIKYKLETMKGAIRNQTLAVHVAERNLESARKHLQNVMIERKTHEILKDKAFEEFKKELEREESKAVDELVSFTHNHVIEG